jgi:hypothetical protein
MSQETVLNGGIGFFGERSINFAPIARRLGSTLSPL